MNCSLSSSLEWNTSFNNPSVVLDHSKTHPRERFFCVCLVVFGLIWPIAETKLQKL